MFDSCRVSAVGSLRDSPGFWRVNAACQAISLPELHVGRIPLSVLRLLGYPTPGHAPITSTCNRMCLVPLPGLRYALLSVLLQSGFEGSGLQDLLGLELLR